MIFTASETKSMKEVLRDHELPVLVRFAGPSIPGVFHNVTPPAILILKVYEQYFLQGNCFLDGNYMVY